MANPQVRPHLRFLPEDSGNKLAEAWQGARWLNELDPNLAGPMVRVQNDDFYVYEPALLRDGRICMPYRWFTRGAETYAKVWGMTCIGGPDMSGSGWVVLKYATAEVNVRDLLSPLPTLKHTAHFYGLPDPTRIIG